MVSKTEKQRAVQFICDRLEDSGLYVILQRDGQHLVAAERNERPEKQPKTIDVVVANFLANIEDFTDRCSANRRNQIYTASLLYKDGKTAFVRMVDSNKFWRSDKSLKGYTLQQINQMLHLRGIEKEVIKFFEETGTISERTEIKTVTYFQPETERLPLSLREFQLKPVDFDYNHLKPSDQAYRFVKGRNRRSVDYKLPTETMRIVSAAKFSFRNNDPYFRAWLVPAALPAEYPAERDFPADPAEFSAEEKARIDLTRMASDAFPELSPKEAYLALRPED